jgi:hypothetical protein
MMGFAALPVRDTLADRERSGKFDKRLRVGHAALNSSPGTLVAIQLAMLLLYYSKPNPNKIDFAMSNTTSTRLKQDAPERRTKPAVAVAASRMKKCWLEVQSGRQLRAINQERSKKAA